MKNKNEKEIKDFLQPYADKLGLEIVEIDFKVNKSPYLTIYIDKDDGVDLDTCAKFHELISDPLDELDPCEESYTLNVSSLGVDWPLKRQKDFDKRIGKLCEVKLFAPIKGVKYMEAILRGFDGENVTLEYNEEEIVIPLKKIIKINEAVIF